MRLTHKLIATALGLGYSPIAPGTMGALGGCLVAVALKYFTNYPDALLLLLIILFFFLGVNSSNKLEQLWGKDPSKIVIDEVVGMWIALLVIPAGWMYFVAAFVLFRLFDIYKPLFIRKMESLNGGWGVMMDDLLAGLYANISVQLIYGILISLNIQ